jgi:chemotaxis protein methyltransferase CheR
METSSSFLLEPDEPLNDQNFWQLAQFIHNYCGIRITAKKRSMVDGRLRHRMRLLGINSINRYVSYLFDEDGHACNSEVVHFIDAITTNKTDFFREPNHFDFIEANILPALAEAGRRKIKTWSAASSTGAEAYTIAMVLEEFNRKAAGTDYCILATDICTEVLDKGLTGCYPDMMIAPIPEELRRRYVLVSRSPGSHEFRIVPALRSKVSFTQLNLMDANYPFDTDFDMIFCRNILIYFDRPTQIEVLGRLCRHLRPGGHLFLGHSETASGINLPLTQVATTIYQRI